jgi:hypothetical protein
MKSISHQLHLVKKGGKGRRCWTEICRKVDGSDKKEEPKGPKGPKETKKASEGEQILMLYTYNATCHEIFVF